MENEIKMGENEIKMGENEIRVRRVDLGVSNWVLERGGSR